MPTLGVFTAIFDERGPQRHPSCLRRSV